MTRPPRLEAAATFARGFPTIDDLPILSAICAELSYAVVNLCGWRTFTRAGVSTLVRFGEPAKLALEDGTVFEGSAIGARGETSGEVVFNTSMTGYQEILTDPSYRGQIVTMTYTEIGNYGTNLDDVESGRPQVAGFIVREGSRISSNFRAGIGLAEYLKQNNIVGLAGIDTRALVRLIRSRGAMKGVISSVDLDNASPKLAIVRGWSVAI